WTLRQSELALAVVAHDPETREAGVDLEAGHAHHVVVVPEHRRALTVRIQVERALPRGGEVFGPAIARRVRDRAMKVDDRESGERSRGRIDLAPAAPRQALHRNTIHACAWCDGDDDRQGARERVIPPHLELNTTPNLDHGTVEE